MWYNSRLMNDNLEWRKPYERWCRKCRQWLDTEFDSRIWHDRRLCPDCQNKRRQAYRQTLYGKQRRKWQNVRYNFNLSKLDFVLLYHKQDGLCQICFQPLLNDIIVDHIPDSDPPIVRGLLHDYCNRRILGIIEKGLYDGNLQNALDYIERFSK